MGEIDTDNITTFETDLGWGSLKAIWEWVKFHQPVLWARWQIWKTTTQRILRSSGGGPDFLVWGIQRMRTGSCRRRGRLVTLHAGLKTSSDTIHLPSLWTDVARVSFGQMFGKRQDGGTRSRRKRASRWNIRHLRETIALRKRWGPKTTWTGNDAHDIEIKNVQDSHYYVTAWSTCRCGKEFKFWHRWELSDPEEHIRTYMMLFGGLCKACSAWTAERADYCMEMECILGFNHKGRCHLISEDPVHIKTIENLRKEMK